MEAKRWEKIDSLLQQALDLPLGERDSFLRLACGEDEELRRGVSLLLRSAENAGSFLEAPAMEQTAQLLALCMEADADLPAGSRVSRYRILEKLGRGGMVYKAEQENPERLVALKVIKPGFAADEVLRRFARESRALARLQHPGIAQIYEAGFWDAGRGPQPYLAMEFIAGQTLTDYADARHLTAQQRLQLMANVCEAVEHAHQKGIIHRDLKPGNILVGEDGRPRILDFGVARVTNGEARATGQTDLGQLIGTLAYMSPEQVLADPFELDTRSDVYALGVILYELLAGRLPYQLGRALHDSVRTIREQEPPPLGAIRRDYRGDIETIVKKALEKDKERRYASVADLASDIRRCLRDEAIAARPPSATYRLRKFAKRHKPLVGGLAAVFAVLTAGISATSWQASRARHAEQAALLERDRAAASEAVANRERDRAIAAERAATTERNRALEEKQRADAKALIANAVDDFLTNDVLAQAGGDTQAQPDIRPDPDLKVRTALDRAAARIAGKFPSEPSVEASVERTIGNAYEELGLYVEAQEHLERALALRSSLGQNDPETLGAMFDLAEDLYRRERKFAPAEALFVKVLEGRRRLLGRQHPDTLATLNKLGDLYRFEGKSALARSMFDEALPAARRLLGENHPLTLDLMNNMALVYEKQELVDQAEAMLRKALQGSRAVLGEEHPETLIVWNNLALLLRDQGRYAEAEPMLIQILRTRRRVLGDEHSDTRDTMNYLAHLYLRSQAWEKAEPVLTTLLEVNRRAVGPTDAKTVTSIANLAEVYEKTRRHADAEKLRREELDDYKTTAPESWSRYRTEELLGSNLAHQRKYAEAEPLLVPGYEGMRQHQADTPVPTRQSMIDEAERLIEQLYRDWGQPDKAAAWQTKLQAATAP